MNEQILTYIKSIPRGGGYKWNEPLTEEETKLQKAGLFYKTGVMEDLEYKNKVILHKDSRGTSYCTGLTLQTWFKTIGVTIDIPVSEMKKVQQLWYCAWGEDGNRKGCQDALLSIKKGMFISREEAKPGDFLQLWRKPTTNNPKGSGHSVIYLSHDNAAGTLTYFSTQRRTNGPGEQTERLETLTELYFVRALNQYVDFDEHRELTEGEKKINTGL